MTIFQVQVIIWNTASKSSAGSHLLHHASVAAIGISPNDRFVASAGGQDDPSILIWDIEAKTPICGKNYFLVVHCTLHPSCVNVPKVIKCLRDG